MNYQFHSRWMNNKEFSSYNRQTLLQSFFYLIFLLFFSSHFYFLSFFLIPISLLSCYASASFFWDKENVQITELLSWVKFKTREELFPHIRAKHSFCTVRMCTSQQIKSFRVIQTYKVPPFLSRKTNDQGKKTHQATSRKHQ